MISILHVITGLDNGGAENNLVRLATRIDRTRFRSSVISLTTLGACSRALTDAGVPVSAIAMRAGRPTPPAVWRLFRTIRQARPDILQTWLPHADLLGQLVGSAAGVKTICWNIRSAELARADHPASLFWVLRWLSSLSHRPACIVTNSSAGKRAHQALGYRPRRWEFIPNGIDVERFVPSADRRHEFRERRGLSPTAPVVGMVGRYHAMKDHATFVDAAALVLQARPDARFVIVGRGVGPDNGALTERVRAGRLADAMLLEGECEDAAAVFPAFDVAVSSSYSEAFPNVIAEAMACGVPCVVTDAGDSAKIVGPAGIVVPIREPAALADGILRLLAADDAARVSLGAAARARIVTEFSVNAMVARYEALYGDLSGQATVKRAS